MASKMPSSKFLLHFIEKCVHDHEKFDDAFDAMYNWALLWLGILYHFVIFLKGDRVVSPGLHSDLRS